MRLLLDTCTFVWLTADPDRLSGAAREAIDRAEGDLALSDASVWEICLKWHAKKIGLPAPPRAWVEQQATIWRVSRIAIASGHCYRATELPDHHRDPFDRLLVAQAIEEGLTILTPDALVCRYPVATLW